MAVPSVLGLSRRGGVALPVFRWAATKTIRPGYDGLLLPAYSRDIVFCWDNFSDNKVGSSCVHHVIHCVDLTNKLTYLKKFSEKTFLEILFVEVFSKAFKFPCKI